MNNQKEFKPYIPAEKVTPELTITSIIMGIILAVVFGAANAYLGLVAGMTVSASIPAAVVAMGVIRVIMRRNSILESNLVQTIGSAGESLAAGAVFTLPALFMWAEEGKMTAPNLVEITIIALIGGLLGVFFMVPLRNALIVREHNTLPYPEGKACAEVLLAGEEGGSNASTVFAGMGFAAIVKFFIGEGGIKALPEEIALKIKGIGYQGEIGTQVSPAIMSVGYICGPRISSYMFAGGVLSWLVIIPLIAMFGAENSAIAQMFGPNGGGAYDVWGTYIRYIGAGALAAGGIISLIKSLPLIVRTFKDSIKSMTGGVTSGKLRTDKDMPMSIVLSAIAALTLSVWLVPAIPVSLLGAAIVVIFGFFFATVSSRMVGIVGSSNNPVSGMAIATLLIGTILLKVTGDSGAHGMRAAIAIGSIICIIAAISGDTSQDLKTGYLLGATPRKQQIGELIGVVASALAIGGTMYLLNTAFGFGEGTSLKAPQATLMKTVVEGVMGNELPWALIIIGVVIALVVEFIGIPVLPFAIGVYLPVHLNACIMVGGLIRLVVDKVVKGEKKEKEEKVNKGILFCSGMIAGEGLMGIILAVLIITGVSKMINLTEPITGLVGESSYGLVTSLGSLALFAIVITVVLAVIFAKGKKKTEK